ncbi:hypothetical protein ACJ67_09555 [Methylophilus sp. TWE2]|nr:hypothetical protein ACJ67_09555 [Methylophilus sp. TWE2]
MIRFDDKGYRVYTIDDLLRYYRIAKSVERIIITIEAFESLRTQRAIGTVLEVRLDEKDPNTSYLTATSDNRDWVDASFSSIQEGLAKFQNKNRWAYSAWTALGVQISGVTLGFLLSLWAASKIAPKLTVENAYILTFLFMLLIFSNTWTYLNHFCLRLIHISFPNIKFIRSDKENLHWLMQAVVGGVIGAIVLYLLGQASSFLLEIMSGIVNKNAP